MSHLTSDEMLKYEKDNDLWWVKMNRVENRIEYLNSLMSAFWRYRKYYVACAGLVIALLLMIIILEAT